MSQYLSLTRSLKGRQATALAISVLVIMLILASCEYSGGKKAPDFQLTRFDGTDFILAEQVGQNVVINFWYPTCPPCRTEMPDFQHAWQKLQYEDIQFLGIFVPQGFDSEQDARDLVDELGLTYAFANDKGARVALDYQVEYFPMTFFIDKHGRIFKRELGVLNKKKIMRIVSEMAQG